ncbi:SDR family oxidoreductase [Oceanicoccus sp. KOV_DT_Chl]|uniref:SDR family NAD(P)-dependent oxidoreductase n=1 Tax=Oceanicoccus sp. KOV_DT_Chl TaxID=1904639 RepID=UPI000C7AF667|nr:SDR family oxidoreductase [Oceanicoccus sp. KOV_DT_Chl]
MAFHGKVALVTGGASGMGRVAALRLANQGASVAIVDLNDKALSETAEESINITPFKCDVSDLAQVQQLIAEVESTMGPIDRVTHCAAIMPGQSLVDMPAENITKMMAINYGGTVNIVKTLMPLMEQRGTGDIIMFGSMAGDVLTHNLGAYCATKSATNTFAEVLIHENKHSPIRFLLVCPPMVNTPLVKQAIEHGPGSLQGAKDSGRMASPESIVDAVETAIEKGRWVVRPGDAAFMVWWRRLFPGLLWWVMAKANKVA